MTADEAAALEDATGPRRLWSKLAAQEARGYEDDIDLEDRFYVVGAYGYVAGLAIHAALIPVFHLLDRDFLAGFNIFSVAVFIGCIWLNRRREMVAAFILSTVEVCVHAILATLILGVETGFFLFLLLQSVIAILGPMREVRMRVFSCATYARARGRPGRLRSGTGSLEAVGQRMGGHVHGRQHACRHNGAGGDALCL